MAMASGSDPLDRLHAGARELRAERELCHTAADRACRAESGQAFSTIAVQHKQSDAKVGPVPGGCMFHCTEQTEAECLEKMLFGAPAGAITVMKRQIKVGSTVFLHNTGTKVVMGPYTAVSEPAAGLH